MTVRLASLLALSLAFIRCTSPCESEGNLKDLARESVSSKLKAPASAKFSEETVMPSKDGQGDVMVAGSVDAQNEFGAMLREEYWVNFKCKDGQPYVAYAWMGDKQWGPEHDSTVKAIDAKVDAVVDSINAATEAMMDSMDAAIKARVDSIVNK